MQEWNSYHSRFTIYFVRAPKDQMSAMYKRSIKWSSRVSKLILSASEEYLSVLRLHVLLLSRELLKTAAKLIHDQQVQRLIMLNEQ